MNSATIIEPVSRTLLATGCELMLGRRDERRIAEVAAMVQSPYEIPWAFLDGDAAGFGEGSPPDVPPAERHVELAYGTILQRHPEGPDVVRDHLRRHPTMASLLADFLPGTEFRARATEIFDNCTRMVPRVWHIHLPKTGGVTVQRAFNDHGWAVVNTNTLALDAFSMQDLAATVGLRRLRKGVLFSGHQRLADIASLTLPFDTCLAFVRDPIDRIVSYFNYVACLLQDDPDHTRSDTRHFVARGFDPTSFEVTYERTSILLPNEQCGLLAPERTARAALARAQHARCALYESDRVSAAVERLLGAPPTVRENASRSVVHRDELPASLLRRILADNSEDLALFRAVQLDSSHAEPST